MNCWQKVSRKRVRKAEFPTGSTVGKFLRAELIYVVYGSVNRAHSRCLAVLWLLAGLGFGSTFVTALSQSSHTGFFSPFAELAKLYLFVFLLPGIHASLPL